MMKSIPLGMLVIALATVAVRAAEEQAAFKDLSMAPGPFQPDWQSLASQYQTPEWFRDAKFGCGQKSRLRKRG